MRWTLVLVWFLNGLVPDSKGIAFGLNLINTLIPITIKYRLWLLRRTAVNRCLLIIRQHLFLVLVFLALFHRLLSVYLYIMKVNHQMIDMCDNDNSIDISWINCSAAYLWPRWFWLPDRSSLRYPGDCWASMYGVSAW